MVLIFRKKSCFNLLVSMTKYVQLTCVSYIRVFMTSNRPSRLVWMIFILFIYFGFCCFYRWSLIIHSINHIFSHLLTFVCRWDHCHWSWLFIYFSFKKPIGPWIQNTIFVSKYIPSLMTYLLTKPNISMTFFTHRKWPLQNLVPHQCLYFPRSLYHCTTI